MDADSMKRARLEELVKAVEDSVYDSRAVRDALLAVEIETMRHFTRLRDAVQEIYYAAHWAPDRAVDDEDGLWERLRDAAGFKPGLAPSNSSQKQGK